MQKTKKLVHVGARWIVVGVALLAPTAEIFAANAQALILRHPLTDAATLRASAADTEAESLAAYLARRSLSAASKEQLLCDLTAAQKAFLSDQLATARELFLKVAQQKWVADWDSPSRQILTYALWRLAQLSESDHEQAKFLDDAARLAPELSPAADLFPPPLRERAQTQRSRMQEKARSWRPFRHFARHEVIVLDGHAYENSPELEISLLPGEHRLSLFSSTYPSTHHVMTSADIAGLSLQRDPLVGGSCEAPSVDTAALEASTDATALRNRDLIIVYENGCMATLRGGNRVVASSKPAANTVAVATRQGLPSIFESPLTRERIFTPEPSPPKPAWKSSWLWLGAGALVLGVVAVSLSQHGAPAPSLAPAPAPEVSSAPVAPVAPSRIPSDPIESQRIPTHE